MKKLATVLWALSYLVSVGVVHASFYYGAGLGGGALLLGYWCLLAYFSLTSVFALLHWKKKLGIGRSLTFAVLSLVGGALATVLVWQISANVTLQVFFPFLSLLTALVIFKTGFTVPPKFYGLLLLPYWAAMALWLWPH